MSIGFVENDSQTSYINMLTSSGWTMQTLQNQGSKYEY